MVVMAIIQDIMVYMVVEVGVLVDMLQHMEQAVQVMHYFISTTNS
jgi:hypothetical protein